MYVGKLDQLLCPVATLKQGGNGVTFPEALYVCMYVRMYVLYIVVGLLRDMYVI